MVPFFAKGRIHVISLIFSSETLFHEKLLCKTREPGHPPCERNSVLLGGPVIHSAVWLLPYLSCVCGIRQIICLYISLCFLVVYMPCGAPALCRRVLGPSSGFLLPAWPSILVHRVHLLHSVCGVERQVHAADPHQPRDAALTTASAVSFSLLLD